MSGRFSIRGVALMAVVLVALMGSGVWYLARQAQESRQRHFADRVLGLFRNELQSQKSQALSLAIALAENEALKEALADEDEERGFAILSSSLARLREYTLMRGVRAQVITPDLTIFARSWDNTYAGMPLDIFREDLKTLTLLKKPKVAIESGRLLSVKATTPVMRGAKAIGYLEILQFFGPITETLRRHRIELLVLMDARLLKVATLMRENPTAHGYVVANQNYDANLLEAFRTVDLPRLLSRKVLGSADRLFIAEPMRNGRGEVIGLFVLALALEDMEATLEGERPLSFFLDFSQNDLYRVVNRWEDPRGGYRSIYDRKLLQLLDTFEGEDRMLVEQEAYEVLMEYSKKELVDIILGRHRRKAIMGEIE
ncbi:hypothetical protein [Hydrogenimonas sp.]